MGTTAAETFESGTFAAAAGGTTMIVDFVLPGEDGSLVNAVDAWDKKTAPQCCADFSYHMAITGWNETIFNEMEQVVKRDASFSRCASLGALPLVHAENGDVVAALQEKYMNEGITGPEGHAYSRPPEVEGEAANRAIMIAGSHPPCASKRDAGLRRAADPTPDPR